MATAPIGLLAWEPPYAVGMALKKPKKKKKFQSQTATGVQNHALDLGILVTADGQLSPVTGAHAKGPCLSD